MAAALVEGWSQYLSVNLAYILAVLAGVDVAIFVWYRYGYRPYRYFKNLGIPGPKPLPFIANLHQAKSELFDFRELCNKYGDTCGFYIGRTPVLVVGNPEMVKEITVKQATNFMDRSAHSGVFSYYLDGIRYADLFSTRGEDWRKTRQLISPSFSTQKLKQLEPQVRESTQRLLQRIATAKGESVDALRWYREITSEVILSTVLGQRVKVQEGEGSDLFNYMQIVLNMFVRSRGHLSFFLNIGAAMSWVAEYLLVPLVRYDFTTFGKSASGLANAVHNLVQDKIKKPKGLQEQLKNKSILEQMAEASKAANLDCFQAGHVVTNLCLMILAGHETTASALTYTSHLLALHPEVQEKLAEEIDNYRQEHPDESLYDAAQNIEYLDMVWQESLRMYAPVGWVARRCNKDTVVNGIPIKEGCLVAIPQYYLHFRDDCWTDPERFNPERFSKSQKSSIHPGAFIPFGSGPRTCIGMRLAIMEAKMTLIEVLSKFRIVKAPETKDPLVLEPGTTMGCKDAIYLQFEELEGVTH